MNEAQKLRLRYEKALAQLQKLCPHSQLTDWMDYMWAPGHGTGKQVRLCKRCEKVCETRQGPEYSLESITVSATTMLREPDTNYVVVDATQGMRRGE